MGLLFSTAFLALIICSVITGSYARPNIILFITDDQDLLLGSMEFMPKTLKFLRKRGTEFENAFVTTPICCPSRSTIISGLYAHVHNVMTNNQNCGGPEWREKFENSTFAVHLKESGYLTSYFGKYLNEYDGSYIPAGWEYWLGLYRNSRFYNYTLNNNGIRKKYGFNYEKDYLTDVLTNQTVQFLENKLASADERPFLSVISYPAPHGPEDPAPQYSGLFEDVHTHRTDSWNYAPNPDKQWLLQYTGKMGPAHIHFTDLLHRRRLQTLQSVDDSIFRILDTLRARNSLHNTYVMFTSDHGYHLGQFGLIKGKSMPYEFDIRVPFFLRGPKIPRGEKRKEPVANIDIPATIMDMAGIGSKVLGSGRSILHLFRPKAKDWRQSVLIERGKMTKLRKIGERFQKQRERFDKYLRISSQCAKAKYAAPCKSRQEWVCVKNPDGRWRIQKCRSNERECKCRKKRETEAEEETEWIDEFLQDSFEDDVVSSDQWFQGVFEAFEHSDFTPRHSRSLPDLTENSVQCKLKSKSLCQMPLNTTRQRWNRRKQKIDDKIKRLKDRLSTFKDIRKMLKLNKPENFASKQKCKCDKSMEKHPAKHRVREQQTGNCSVPQMNCFEHNSDHWRTPPLWPSELGSFCFCQNANNNSYWCIRTVNSTHNFLYCEFITGFLSYYDLTEDLHQLTNAIFQLNNSTLSSLNSQLALLKKCQNSKECEHYSSARWFNPLPQEDT